MLASLARGQPADGWTRVQPEDVGLDSAALVGLFDFVREHQIRIHSLQIVRRGKLALDAYFYPYAAGSRHDVASVTKSITSTLVGLAIERGNIQGVEERLVPLDSDRRKRSITLEDLLTMQAGWDCGFEPNERRLFEMRQSSDWLQFMIGLPMVAEPGTRWAYCSGNCHLLSALLTRKTGTNALAFARRELFEPLDISDVVWPSDARGNNHGWGDLQMHPLDMARIGQLFLQRGRWKDRQIISERWVTNATCAHVKRTSNSDYYGYFWWVKGTDFPGMFEAVGRGGQRITVWPAQELVIVFTGGGFEPGDLAKFLLKSLKSGTPKTDASPELKERLVAAARPPAVKPISKLPALAAQISGKTFGLDSNSLGLGTIGFTFGSPAEAKATVTWNNRTVSFPVGLDGVDRFSVNPLNSLSQAAKGKWLNVNTFVLSINLVGGINIYDLRHTFSQDGQTVQVAIAEATGLANERFAGRAQK
ncbi:MAG TPA: serine hydrolase [Verrucomicrobiae bacterium]|nr:serine hydrolase [Verrucomicrobiae bacterium]